MSDTGPAKLPGLFALRTNDPNINHWAQAVNEHLEVRNGARGNPAEKTVVQRDLEVVIKRIEALAKDSTNLGNDLTAKLDKAKAQLSATATAKPATQQTESWKEELDSIRAELDALSRRISSSGSASYSGLFAYGDGPFGKRWYLRSDVALSAAEPGYSTNLGDILLALFTMHNDIAYLKQRELEITQVATQYLVSHEQRIAALEARP